MHTKEHATKKPTHFQMETRYTRDNFLWKKGSLAENVQNLQFLLNSISWNCVQYIFISIGAVFLMR